MRTWNRRWRVRNEPLSGSPASSASSATLWIASRVSRTIQRASGHQRGDPGRSDCQADGRRSVECGWKIVRREGRTNDRGERGRREGADRCVGRSGGRGTAILRGLADVPTALRTPRDRGCQRQEGSESGHLAAFDPLRERCGWPSPAPGRTRVGEHRRAITAVSAANGFSLTTGTTAIFAEPQSTKDEPERQLRPPRVGAVGISVRCTADANKRHRFQRARGVPVQQSGR